MIYFGLLQAAPAISTPTSVGFQIESTALSYLQDNQVEKIEFYAACINKNNAYVKHSVSISSDTESKRVELPVCTETGVNMDRQFGLPAYGTVVNAYVLVYGQKLKVLECKLVDDFGGTLTIQECSTDPQTTLTLSFAPEVHEFLKGYPDITLTFNYGCAYSSHSLTFLSTETSQPIIKTEVCADGLPLVELDPLIGDLNEDFINQQGLFGNQASFSIKDSLDYVYCYTLKHVPWYQYHFHECELFIR